MYSETWATLVYALGAVQNLCTDPTYAQVMIDVGANRRLEAVAEDAGQPEQTQMFAAGWCACPNH